MALRLSEGLGVVRERLKDMICSLTDFKTRNLCDLVAASGVPPYDLTMNGDGVDVAVFSLSVVDVDFLPRRQDEHSAMKRIARELGLQHFFRER